MKKALANYISGLPLRRVHVLHDRKITLRVINDEFEAIKVEWKKPGETDGWQPANREERFRFRKGIETAVHVLYVCDLPHGECIVQRETDDEYHLFKVSGKADRNERRPPSGIITYGADVECLVVRRGSHRLVPASQWLRRNGAIGYDDAVALKGNKVLRPIVELRPEPAADGDQLFINVSKLYVRLEQFLRKNGLCAVSEGRGRLSLGGHLHIGGVRPSFSLVRRLDVFLALPMALIEPGDPTMRRKRFGRFGSVRANDFDGFEYRVLASWYDRIPELLPMFRWFCYLVRHYDRLPYLSFSTTILESYNAHSIDLLKETAACLEGICADMLPADDYKCIATPFFRLLR
ncbi:MAG TPA: hypothetical protein VFK44_12270 [Bacillales bacterium]|nr:hypothetical protein [Bacillales bacterium]